ncbi:MAG: ribosome small subunit-dependent GTPase A [Xanthomonadales bacterium]|nr:ribosome small subunit-dependent GTPase A [Xanthomonadales bacterium]
MPPASTSEGRVLASWGGHGVVRLDDGDVVDCRYRRSVGRPVCGDRVYVAPDGGGGMAVESILPRRNAFIRADDRQRPQQVAANLDQVAVVVAPRPEPTRDLLARYLVAVHSLGIDPVLVLNKAELLGADDRPEALDRLDYMESLGYSLVRTSCKGPPGLDALRPLLDSRTSILVGQSGVGKSSLVAALLPDLDIQVGALSRVTGKGTHTTTTTTLYELPGGGALIDSPGVWEYGIWALEPADIAHGFLEFRPHLGQCRFNDCRHDAEPGCAVKAAVGAGVIPEWRHESYRRVLSRNAAD